MKKLKICQHCSKNITIAYRIQAQPGKIWEFVCGACCLKAKQGKYYRYGGTWKAQKR